MRNAFSSPFTVCVPFTECGGLRSWADGEEAAAEAGVEKREVRTATATTATAAATRNAAAPTEEEDLCLFFD